MSPGQRAPLQRVCVLLPTYDERETLPALMRRLRASAPELDVLVIDDDSPDGTGAVADELARTDTRVQVMHRPVKEGLGRAYLAGFAWAKARGYDAVVQIDADGSHPPERLPALLSAAQHADVVIGSRWVPGGSVRNWPWPRQALSLGGNLYTRLSLGIPVRDATAGYRVYRLAALREMGLAAVASQGYCFQVDLTLRAVEAGLCIIEVPIEFAEREVGTSKMDGTIVREALGRVTLWGMQRRWQQVKGVWQQEDSWHQLAE